MHNEKRRNKLLPIHLLRLDGASALDGDRCCFGCLARSRALHVDRRWVSGFGLWRQPLSDRGPAGAFIVLVAVVRDLSSGVVAGCLFALVLTIRHNPIPNEGDVIRSEDAPDQ